MFIYNNNRMNRIFLITLMLGMPALCGVGAIQTSAKTVTATMNLYPLQKHQHIDGFGGTGMTSRWEDAYNKQKVEMLWGTGEGQVGLNIMRIRVNPNENNWGEYGNPIKWARQVNPSLQVFATPWTPPKKYKTHNTNKYQNDFGTWVWPLVEHQWGGEGSNGGAINPANYNDYADFLERYRQTMEAKGCPIDMISVQNESDYTPTDTVGGTEHASYESCIYSPKEMAAMCKALRQRLDPKCKVMGPECFGWGENKYNTTLSNIKDATDNIDVWGNHLYGSNDQPLGNADWTYVKTITQKTGRPMWETEFLLNYDGSNAPNYHGEFTPEYAMIESIEKTMKAGYSAYVYYSMYDHFFASNHGGSDTQLWKRAWVFSHYAKYATGKWRIQSSFVNGSGLTKAGSAYTSANGDTLVVMLLNPTADTYELTINLPFEPVRIKQVTTGDNANALTIDVTDRYANGTKSPVVQLQPGMFYTFEFLKTIDESQPQELAPAFKQPTWNNPLSATQFMADPTSVEYDGRLYVFATNDQQEYNLSHGLQANTYGNISQLVCLSSADLANWTTHEVIDVKSVAPWATCAWAPSVVSRKEADGKTHFYLYFSDGASAIGVLTATSPTGPWTDPLGHALIDRSTPGLGSISWIIDPGACVKSDGSEAYLTFGGGEVMNTELMPGNSRIVKLGDDMISLAGDIATIDAPCHFEANELNYVGNMWVYSYCTRWSISSDWSTYSTASAPSAASIVYMTNTGDPVTGEWSYKGQMLDNPGALGYPAGNNHGHLQLFGGRWLMLFHTQWLERQLGLTGGYRNLQISPITVLTGRRRIDAVTKANAALTALTPMSNVTVNPYEQQPGSLAAIQTANWTLVRNVNFAAADTPAQSLVLKVRGNGTLEVRDGGGVDFVQNRPQAADAEPIATAQWEAPADGVKIITVPLTSELSALTPQLYFIFTHQHGGEVLSWQFRTQPADQSVGDINGDGHADVADIIRLMGAMNSGAFEASADLNGDKVVNFSDVILLMDIITSQEK